MRFHAFSPGSSSVADLPSTFPNRFHPSIHHKMAQRLTYRRRLSYNTRSNKVKIVKTPGGKLTYQYTKKKACGPKCGDCGDVLRGIVALRPRAYSQVSKRQKTVQRAYGGSRCATCVRSRYDQTWCNFRWSNMIVESCVHFWLRSARLWRECSRLRLLLPNEWSTSETNKHLTTATDTIRYDTINRKIKNKGLLLLLLWLLLLLLLFECVMCVLLHSVQMSEDRRKTDAKLN